MIHPISEFLSRPLVPRVGTILLVALLVTACGRSAKVRVQGYVEGEFVYVSSQLAGPLQSLQVQRGAQVKAGDPLFELDRTMEKAALDQASAELLFTETDLQRQQKLALTPGSASERDLQLALSTRDQDGKRLAQAQWNYDQKVQSAPARRAGFRYPLSPGRVGRRGQPRGRSFAAGGCERALFRAGDCRRRATSGPESDGFRRRGAHGLYRHGPLHFSAVGIHPRRSSTARKAAPSWSS